jgi:MFS family permease
VYYIGHEAINSGITDVNLGFYLLPILNTASVARRVLPNFLTDKIGPLKVLCPASFISGILALCWIGIANLGGTIAFALLYGFFSGGFVSVPPVALVTLTPDMRKLGTRMGQCFFISSLGLLVGSPVSGEIVSGTDSYLGLKIFSGLGLIVTGLLIVWARIPKAGWKIRTRA